jgi:Major Facilitator Superfamily
MTRIVGLETHLIYRHGLPRRGAKDTLHVARGEAGNCNGRRLPDPGDGYSPVVRLFLTPIAMDLGVGRQVFGLAIAVQNLLWGLAQPFAGAVADKFGAVHVTIAGAVLYAAGLGLAAFAADPLALNVTLGVLVGLALAGTTYGTVLGAVGRVVPAEKRSLAFGVCTAAGSFGMFAVVPGAAGYLHVARCVRRPGNRDQPARPARFRLPRKRSPDRPLLRSPDDRRRDPRSARSFGLLAAQRRLLRLRFSRRLRSDASAGLPRR